MRHERVEPTVEPTVEPDRVRVIEPIAASSGVAMTVERAELAVPSDPAQISVARRFVRRALSDVLAADVVADLQLIASELVSNTIEHGGTDEVLVAVEWSAAAVTVLVSTDATAGELGPVDTWTIAEVDRLSGRGLGIVRELADAVSIDEVGAARRVVATIDLTARS